MHNFGQIKHVYNTILSETVASKDKSNKSLFGKYVKALKENEALKTQFLVYTNIENKIEESEYKASEFVKANIALLDKFDKKELMKLNETLMANMPEYEVEFPKDKSNLYENINTLIFTEKNGKTIDKVVDATSEVVNYITTNKPKVVAENVSELPPSILTAIYVDKFNSKYENLDEATLRLVKSILESDEEGRKEIYKDLHKSCVDLVNDKLNEGVEKEKLLAVKEKLLNMEFIQENHMTDISSLIELKETLSE
jgi:hypothetical protein